MVMSQASHTLRSYAVAICSSGLRSSFHAVDPSMTMSIAGGTGHQRAFRAVLQVVALADAPAGRRIDLVSQPGGQHRAQMRAPVRSGRGQPVPLLRIEALAHLVSGQGFGARRASVVMTVACICSAIAGLWLRMAPAPVVDAVCAIATLPQRRHRWQVGSGGFFRQQSPRPGLQLPGRAGIAGSRLRGLVLSLAMHQAAGGPAGGPVRLRRGAGLGCPAGQLGAQMRRPNA